MSVKILCLFPVELRFATANLVDDSGNWPARVLNVGTLNRAIGKERDFEISSVSIEFDDSDRFFRVMMSGEDRYIAGKTVEIYTETDILTYRGTVQKWSFTEATFSIEISDLLSGLRDSITPSIDRQTFPNCADEAEGEAIPIIYGFATGPTGKIKAYRVDTYLFILSSHECTEITGVYLPDGTDITESCLFDFNEDGNHYINYVYTDETIVSFIQVNVKGKKTSGNLIEDPITALIDMLTAYTSISYDTAAFTAAQIALNERGYKIAYPVTSETTVESFMSDFCRSFDCNYYINLSGELVVSHISLWGQTPDVYLQEREILSLSFTDDPTGVVSTVRYLYDYDPTVQTFRKQPYYTRSLPWPDVKQDPLHLRCVSDQPTAFDVVQRYAFQRMNPPRNVRLTIPLRPIDLGDIINVTHSSLIPTKKRTLFVNRADFDFMSSTVTLETDDFTFLSGSIAVLPTSTFSPTWATATDDEKQYMYLCDETGVMPDGTPGKKLY